MTALDSSFRDPSGHLFKKDGVLYRQVNDYYKDDYELLKSSGLYQELIEEKLMVPHEDLEGEGCYKVLKPELVPFISYPYEWCFSQLKDAALLTLDIQKRAIDRGMILKDASAYNVQFMNGRAVFIDTLSFEKYNEGEPWAAYRQFCQHFYAPLVLMGKSDYRLNHLLKSFIDGVPLDLASKLLPWKSKLSPAIFAHIHIHAKSQKKHQNASSNKPMRPLTKFGLLAIIDSLKSSIEKLSWGAADTEWGEYYDDTNYSDQGLTDKAEIIGSYIDQVKPGMVWDLGANTGFFSRVAANRGIYTVAYDIDYDAVEKNYRQMKSKKEDKILPLLLDLTNPTPDIGWANRERDSVAKRATADCLLCMAVIHHLAISNNIPLGWVANYFSSLTNHSLIIEFVPKSDSQVQRLLATRKDIFSDYTQECFEKEFSEYFTIEESTGVKDSERVIYRMRKK